MKKIIFLLVIAFLTTSCKENTNDSKSTNKTSKNKKTNNKDLFVTVTFSDGPLKGTHKFIKEKGKVMSTNTISYSETSKNPNQINSTSLTTNSLTSENGKLKLLFITKSFKGKIVKGNHEVIYFTNSSKEQECGKFMIENKGHSFSFNRMYSKNISCNDTKLTGFSDWKEGSIMNRRTVSGVFNDTFELDFRNKDGKSVKKVKTNVKVSFNSRQQEMKSAYKK